MKRDKYPAIRQGKDGKWHAWVTVGGTRKHVERDTEAETKERVDELLDLDRSGVVIQPGRALTVQQWLTNYLDTVAPRRCDPETVKDYRSKMVHWVYPVIGHIDLARLQPGQLEEVYLKMQQAGRAESFALKVHRILSRAFEVALRRSLLQRNPAKLLDAPQLHEIEQRPLTLAEAEEVLAAASAEGRRNPARWSACLALGLRQGEALGLRWEYVDLDRGEMRVWWQLRRRSFEHGCAGSPCGRKRGGNCPQRQLPLRDGETALLDLSRPATKDRRTGLILKRPKGKSKRTVPLPTELVELLRDHRAGQEIERVLAANLWQDHDLVFADEQGQALDPAKDHHEWKSLLQQAGVQESRLHDGRHTAGTVMIALGVPIEVVQEVLGHSDLRTTRGYVHVASEMARAATQRMGSALLKSRTAR